MKGLHISANVRFAYICKCMVCIYLQMKGLHISANEVCIYLQMYGFHISANERFAYICKRGLNISTFSSICPDGSANGVYEKPVSIPTYRCFFFKFSSLEFM